MALSLLVLALALPAVIGSGLVDHPVTGDKQTILDGTWALTAPSASINTTGEVGCLYLQLLAFSRRWLVPTTLAATNQP